MRAMSVTKSPTWLKRSAGGAPLILAGSGGRCRFHHVIVAPLEPADHLRIVGLAHLERRTRHVAGIEIDSGIDRFRRITRPHHGERPLPSGNRIDAHSASSALFRYFSANTGDRHQVPSSKSENLEAQGFLSPKSGDSSQ